MKASTFWTSVVIAILIVFGGIAVISGGPGHCQKESGAHGYIDFEPMEIFVPVTVLDFTDEAPMLITPDMAE